MHMLITQLLYHNEYMAAAAMLAVMAMTGLMADTELPITFWKLWVAEVTEQTSIIAYSICNSNIPYTNQVYFCIYYKAVKPQVVCAKKVYLL